MDLDVRVTDLDSGRLLVTGPPGSGKTTLLRERFARLVERGADPERVALFALGRRAAREGRLAIAHRIARSIPALPALTPHAFAYGIVSRRFREIGYERPPRLLTAAEQYETVRSMLASDGPTAWPHFGHLRGTTVLARALAELVLRTQERLLDADALDALAATREEYGEVARFYRRYLDAGALAGWVDFGGLLQQAAALARTEPAEPAFDHLLIDDYEDATLALEAIVGALARRARSVVVAADPDGGVFSYRGAGREPLARIGDVLAPIDRIDLPESRRARPAAAVAYAHPGEEADAIAHELLRLRVDEDVPWGEAAVVLRRYGPALTALRHALARHGIPHVVVGEGATVASEPAVRPVLDLIRYALRRDDHDDLLERLLLSPVVGLDPHELRRLRREARTRGLALRKLVEEGEVEAADLRDRIESFRALVTDLPEIARTERPDGVFAALWRRLPHVAAMVSAGAERPLDALAELGDVLARFSEGRPGASILDYLEAVEAAAFGPDPFTLPEERRPDAVRVTTAHLAHGREFEAVVVAGCVEGEFPSLAAPASPVSLDALLRPERAPAERMRERLREERALFRLACSRARRHTVLFASRATSARTPRTPSRFAASELGLEWGPPAEAPIVASARGLEASLRRRLADPNASDPQRLAALAALARTGGDPRRWWGGRDWTGSDEPLHPEGIRTSYSRLDPLDNCALQYLYGTEMGLDREQSYQMWLGSIVHDIIDRAQKDEVAQTAEALHAALDAAWKPEVFPNRAVEHRRYLDARDMLSRWLEGERGDPVASEVGFEFPIDGATLRGKIDAVFPMTKPRDLRIVDYKTGRSWPTREEAKEDLQLGAYYLACKRTPELAELGEPRMLQFAFIAIERDNEIFKRVDVWPSKIPDYEQNVEAKIKALLGKIRAEDFAPSPDADCMFCRFKTICPMWPEGREAVP